jgi:hypothetical protein
MYTPKSDQQFQEQLRNAAPEQRHQYITQRFGLSETGLTDVLRASIKVRNTQQLSRTEVSSLAKHFPGATQEQVNAFAASVATLPGGQAGQRAFIANILGPGQDHRLPEAIELAERYATISDRFEVQAALDAKYAEQSESTQTAPTPHKPDPSKFDSNDHRLDVRSQIEQAITGHQALAPAKTESEHNARLAERAGRNDLADVFRDKDNTGIVRSDLGEDLSRAWNDTTSDAYHIEQFGHDTHGNAVSTTEQ